jgi:hypothetical protein
VRTLSDEQLAELARPPRAGLEEARRSGESARVEESVAQHDRVFRGVVEGYMAWAACTIQYVAMHHGVEGTTVMARATRALMARHPERTGPDEPDEPTVGSGAADNVLASFDAASDVWRRRHDVGRDWVSALLSAVYRTYGVDELEAALVHAGEQTLLHWMEKEVQRTPEARIAGAARMMHGHFTTFELCEDDEKYTIVQDPCGSCTRQILSGAYGAPLELAVVEEAHTVTWGRGGMPIYRTHVPVMHDKLGRERLGFPLPVVRCPAGLGTGPCRVAYYKDPRHPDALLAPP